MGLTEEEKKERNRLAAKRYREKLKEKAKRDPKAQELLERHSYNTQLSRVKSFIKRKVKKGDISAIGDILAERQKELREKSKK